MSKKNTLPIQERKYQSYLEMGELPPDLWDLWHKELVDELSRLLEPSLYSVNGSPLKSRLAAKKDPVLDRKIKDEGLIFEKEIASLRAAWLECPNTRKWIQQKQNEEINKKRANDT